MAQGSLAGVGDRGGGGEPVPGESGGRRPAAREERGNSTRRPRSTSRWAPLGLGTAGRGSPAWSRTGGRRRTAAAPLRRSRAEVSWSGSSGAARGSSWAGLLGRGWVDDGVHRGGMGRRRGGLAPASFGGRSGQRRGPVSTNGRWGSRSRAPLGPREAGDGGSPVRSGTAATMAWAAAFQGAGS